MLIEIRELETHPVDFKEQIGPGVIDFIPDVRQTGDLRAAGRAQLVREQDGKQHVLTPSSIDSATKTSHGGALYTSRLRWRLS